MRLSRRTLTISAALAGVATAAIMVVPNAYAAVNLLANPGFESGSLSGWSCTAGTAVVTARPAPARTRWPVRRARPTPAARTHRVPANTQLTLSAYVRGSYVFIGVDGASTWTPAPAAPTSGCR